MKAETKDMILLPLATIFDMFHRTVRDIAREHGKEIELVITGEDTLLDRNVLERLSEPLIHLVRNAIDHAIESPDERAALGKKREGRITLTASHQGDHVIVRVEDDGRGIDVQKIRDSAVKKGIVGKTELLEMDEKSILMFMFHPALSTKEEVTELSGRGVGLDVVKRKIEELKGSVDVAHQVGQGAVFTLTLPLTLALTKAFLFSTNGTRLAIQASSIDALLNITEKDIQNIGSHMSLRHKQKMIPLIEAGDVFDLKDERRQRDGTTHCIVATHDSQNIALIVDEFIGKRELSVRPMDKFLAGVRNIAGAALLEDGGVVFLLNVPGVIESARAGRAPGNGERQKKAETSPPKNILIVENSLITREIEKSILESCGHHVGEAKDGLEALEKMKEGDFDLVIVDTELPGMDCFTLIENMRTTEKYKKTPVVIVSKRTSEEDRKRGVEAGADAYITQGDLEVTTLIDVIQRLL